MVTAKLKHLRISPRKVRLVADLIRGLTVREAEKQLKFLTKRAARPVLKLLDSAVANAQNNANLAKEGLFISKIVVEVGPSLKRWRPRAMGRATPIMKRTSHITLVLEEKEPSVVPAKVEPVAPTKEKVEEKVEPIIRKEEKPEMVEEIRKIEEEKKPVPRPVPPPRPYPTTSQSKKRFFSRQTFGNAKKLFRRKSF